MLSSFDYFFSDTLSCFLSSSALLFAAAAASVMPIDATLFFADAACAALRAAHDFRR